MVPPFTAAATAKRIRAVNGLDEALRRVASSCSCPVFQSGFTYRFSTRTRAANQQLHGVHNAAHVVDRTGCNWIRPAAPWRVGQSNPLDGLVRRIEDSHRQQIACAGTDRFGRIQFKRIFSSFVAADQRAIDVHLSQVVHGRKSENVTTVLMWIGWCTKSRQYHATPW